MSTFEYFSNLQGGVRKCLRFIEVFNDYFFANFLQNPAVKAVV